MRITRRQLRKLINEALSENIDKSKNTIMSKLSKKYRNISKNHLNVLTRYELKKLDKNKKEKSDKEKAFIRAQKDTRYKAFDKKMGNLSAPPPSSVMPAPDGQETDSQGDFYWINQGDDTRSFTYNQDKWWKMTRDQKDKVWRLLGSSSLGAFVVKPKDNVDKHEPHWDGIIRKGAQKFSDKGLVNRMKRKLKNK